MNATRLKEIMDHAEVLFKPEWAILRDKYDEDLRQAQFRASQTHNSAAMFPAEAECHIAHAKALIVARANYLATAYMAFHEAAGSEADAELYAFFSTILSASKSGFAAQANMTAERTGTSASQVPHLVQKFEPVANAALLEGRRILDKQRVEMKNNPPKPVSQSTHIYNAHGHNSRITIGKDNSSNVAICGSNELFRHVKAELDANCPAIQAGRS